MMSKYDEAQKRSIIKYAKNKLKRIPLDVQTSYYDEVLKPYCDSIGMPVNSFIKAAITEKIERDTAANGADQAEKP